MEMTIDEAIRYYEDKNVVLTEEEALANTIAIKTMRKYQTMQEVLEKVWNVPACMLDESECLNQIMETYRTVRY